MSKLQELLIKNWKTTLIGIIGGTVTFLSTTPQFKEHAELLASIAGTLTVFLGTIARDK
jgi:hypothetical protein